MFKVCKFCKKEFFTYRKDSKFCTASCRYKFWDKKKPDRHDKIARKRYDRLYRQNHYDPDKKKKYYRENKLLINHRGNIRKLSWLERIAAKL